MNFSSLAWNTKALSPELAAKLSPECRDVASSFGIPSRAGEKSWNVALVQEALGKNPLQREAYTLSVSADGVKIVAENFAGFFNALQTLRQLIHPADARWRLPFCEIHDEPAFQIRGVMLDVGRNYIEPSLIKEIMRKLSRYKINTLHLHLTEDPAWRFEVTKYPQLTDGKHFWPTRQPGEFYTQEELRDLIGYCAALNVRVIPEIDMPGHSAAFGRAMGFGMQTPQGLAAMKEIVDEAAPLFIDPLFHIGSDEVRVTMKNFMPEMIAQVRRHDKEVIVWYPGHVPDKNAVLMCWGENESGHSLEGAKGQRYIDCNGFYLDWMDSQSGVLQAFFQQPCEVASGNDNALGGMLAVWTDGALSSGRRMLEQYPFYPVALTFAERLWRGAGEKRKDLMAAFPQKGTPEWAAIDEFENRLIWHRDHTFQSEPFAYVKQSEMHWRLIGPFDHKGKNDTSFEPERVIKEEYACDGETLRWQPTPAYGGAVWLRHLFAMFDMHRKRYRLDHWPTVMSPKLGKNSGTCYALTYVESPVEQDVHFMFGLNGMWGHSGGYRTSRAPERGSWDFSGGNVWINDAPVPAPDWKFQSLPWTGWGKGRIEEPLTEEGYFFRPPVRIHLRKGVNKILVRSVFGHWKGDDGERKWFFCAMPVHWDGRHFTEVTNLTYPDMNGSRDGVSESNPQPPNPLAPTDRPATQAREKYGKVTWLERHAQIIARNKSVKPEIVFLGDSITHFWHGEPTSFRPTDAESWKKATGGRVATNMGFGYDYIENALWRIENGELDGIAPKVIVINLGTNNLGHKGDTPEACERGMKTLLAAIRARQAAAKILLLGIYPRREAKLAWAIGDTNRRYAALAGNDVRFLDIGEALAADGNPRVASAELFRDGVHPNAAGYAVISEKLAPVITELAEAAPAKQWSLPPKAMPWQ